MIVDKVESWDVLLLSLGSIYFVDQHFRYIYTEELAEMNLESTTELKLTQPLDTTFCHAGTYNKT